jgi:thiamine-monophosphate kinase
VNLSDLAAMAARPIAGFCALALPRDGLQLAEGLIEGMLPLAGEFDLAIAGGDTNVWDGPLVISITLSGRCDGEKTLLRSGARPGDHLLTTGQFGGSLLGHQFDFEPRVHEAIYLNEHYTLHAGIDCSDGLGLDLARLAEESGCGAAIDLAAVPVAEAARQLAGESEDGVSAIDHALSDGEDFELLLAVPPDDAEQIVSRQPLDVNVTRIGTFVEQPGLWQTTESGLLPLEARGYQHRVGR